MNDKNDDNHHRVVIKNENNDKLKRNNNNNNRKLEFIKRIIFIVFIELVIDRIITLPKPTQTTPTTRARESVDLKTCNNKSDDKIGLLLVGRIGRNNRFYDLFDAHKQHQQPRLPQFSTRNESSSVLVISNRQPSSISSSSSGETTYGVVLILDLDIFLNFVCLYLIMLTVNKLYKIKYSLSSGSLSSTTSTSALTSLKHRVFNSRLSYSLSLSFFLLKIALQKTNILVE